MSTRHTPTRKPRYAQETFSSRKRVSGAREEKTPTSSLRVRSSHKTSTSSPNERRSFRLLYKQEDQDLRDFVKSTTSALTGLFDRNSEKSSPVTGSRHSPFRHRTREQESDFMSSSNWTENQYSNGYHNFQDPRTNITNYTINVHAPSGSSNNYSRGSYDGDEEDGSYSMYDEFDFCRKDIQRYPEQTTQMSSHTSAIDATKQQFTPIDIYSVGSKDFLGTSLSPRAKISRQSEVDLQEHNHDIQYTMKTIEDLHEKVSKTDSEVFCRSHDLLYKVVQAIDDLSLSMKYAKMMERNNIESDMDDTIADCLAEFCTKIDLVRQSVFSKIPSLMPPTETSQLHDTNVSVNDKELDFINVFAIDSQKEKSAHGVKESDAQSLHSLSSTSHGEVDDEQFYLNEDMEHAMQCLTTLSLKPTVNHGLNSSEKRIMIDNVVRPNTSTSNKENIEIPI